ncbi:hypothetical protein Ddye_015809 [Dipteronia dyeriana]|uniref:RRM domain-containing protein n=1 Tax=Dipteronia dyeriana TaxID=168575 RepID=A0AAD9U5I3_9ROSI|nr:hypothetical protein Ddye_015809 [Dipteronia dyeriana]
MRETSERSSGYYGWERKRDFRDNLHSIFIDNLNDKIDLLCLWGLFKTFGKVRDIYLAEANKNRIRGFAFVRFATLVEARRVAGMTKGMHVYGWPIEVKVALYVWNSRRTQGVAAAERRAKNGHGSDGEHRDGQLWDVRRANGKHRDNISFAEVVRDERQKEKRDVNHEFTKLVREERQKEKGVCNLEELETLVLNRMISEKTWIPLNYWNESFVLLIGNRLGNTLHIEKDTRLKRRMDRGKLLIAISNDRLMSKRLKIEMDALSLDCQWIVEKLSLKVEGSSEEEAQDFEFEKKKCSWQADTRGKESMEQRDLLGGRKTVWNYQKEGNIGSLSKVRCDCTEIGAKDKGKAVYVTKSKKRPTLVTCMEGKLDLQKKKVESDKGDVVSSWSTSLDSDTEEGQMMDFGKKMGDCSNVKQVGKKVENGHQGGLRKVDIEKGLNRGLEAHQKGPEDRDIFTKSLSLQLNLESSNEVEYGVSKKISLQQNDQGVLTISNEREVSIPITVDLREAEKWGNNVEQRQTNRTTWNFHQEVTKVIEKGVSLGVIRNTNGKKINNMVRSCNQSQQWAALGFDFNNKVFFVCMLIISWNVRGLGKAKKRRMVRGLVSSQNPDFVFLQESKLKVFDQRVIRSLGGTRLSRGIGVQAEGASEGSLETKRRELWDFILGSMQTLMAPWLVGGDFNTVLDPAERVGAVVNMGHIRGFNRFVFQANLINNLMHGSKFTWSNNREIQAWARLDRFLLSPSILLWFPNIFQKGLPRCLSDHNPVMISDVALSWGPSPFRFLNWWLEEKDMMKETLKGWKDCKAVDSKCFLLFSKSKAVKLTLKRWLDSKKCSSLNSKELEVQLGAIDVKAEIGGWTDSLRIERHLLRENLWKSLRRDEQFWRQKSSINWLMEGDKNTFFSQHGYW